MVCTSFIRTLLPPLLDVLTDFRYTVVKRETMHLYLSLHMHDGSLSV